MRVSSTARSNFSGSALKPGASPYISNGMAISATMVSSRSTNTQAGHRLLGEGARRLLALALQALGEQRHEGRVEGALAEQAAEQVGEAEGDEEGVRHRARCPSVAAIRMSRTKPSTRLTMVRPPTVAKAR